MTETLVDYVTGNRVANAGAEQNRQQVERILVEEKGYSRQEIQVDFPVTVTVDGQPYTATLDLVVFCGPRPFMAIRCVAGSIGSFEREILAGARLAFDYPLPVAVSTDGRDALVRDGITGKPTGQGLDAIVPRALAAATRVDQTPLSQTKKEREMILFRSFTLDRQHKPAAGR